MNRRNILMIISVFAFIVIVGGISYSYFVYNEDVGDVSLTAGEISIDFSGVNGNQTMNNVIPLSDDDGMISTSYFDFTVNATVDTERIYYEVYLLPSNTNTLDSRYLKTYLTDQSNNELKGITVYNDLGNSFEENGKVIYKGIIEVNNNGVSRTETKNFRLRVWLDENYSAQASKTFNFDVYLYAKNVDEDYKLPYGVNLLKKAILAKEADGGNCSKITWTDTDDDITYLSGNNNCVDMNYVWYSGKLWRIVSIYPDGAMKLITQNNITSIAYDTTAGSYRYYTNENTSSRAYTWLNEDFYSTLYNPNYFFDTSKKWNQTSTNNLGDKIAETYLVTADVGLLNSYEYYNSYRCTGTSLCNGSQSSSGYLNISYYWWLLNQYRTNTDVWNVHSGGGGDYSDAPDSHGIRPVIVLKNDVEFVGDGTLDSPYKIVGDKSVGLPNELINSRLSGEYVKLKNGNNEQVFRIIEIDGEKTKLIAMDYAGNGATKAFSTGGDTLWGSGTTTDNDTWYTYLNDVYYPDLVSTYGNLFDSAMYYFGTSSYNYKQSICSSNTYETTKDCPKTSQKGFFNVGLPRYGELFATQQSGGYSSTPRIWLINRHSSTRNWSVIDTGKAMFNAESTSLFAARPTVHLKSTVKILSGSGTESDPYIVGL